LPSYVMSLAETADDYLIGSMGGLWLVNKESRRLSKYPLVADDAQVLDFQIRHIQVLSDSGLLLSTHLGLYEVNGGRLTKRYPQSGNVGVFKSVRVGDTIWLATQGAGLVAMNRSEEHTSELQSREKLVCRLLLE